MRRVQVPEPRYAHASRCSITILALLGILALGCRCASTKNAARLKQTLASVGSAQLVGALPVQPIDTDLAQLLRARKFEQARQVLSKQPPHVMAQPAMRFVQAYLAIESDAGAHGLKLLDGLNGELPELAPDVERLRALAQLQTADAMVGAAWLEAQGRSGICSALVYRSKLLRRSSVAFCDCNPIQRREPTLERPNAAHCASLCAMSPVNPTPTLTTCVGWRLKSQGKKPRATVWQRLWMSSNCSLMRASGSPGSSISLNRVGSSGSNSKCGTARKSAW
jgi:hypothetical protein